MSAFGCFVYLGIGLLPLTAPPQLAEAAERQCPHCSMLFQRYIAQTHVGSSLEHAAVELIAHCGRNCGYWRNLVAEMHRHRDRTERSCVLTLGKMLAVEANARLIIQRQAESSHLLTAMQPTVKLPPTVVEDLIACAREVDGFRRHSYLMALVKSVDPRCINQFIDELQAPEVLCAPNRDMKFLAAVGLANFGRAEGVEWLLQHLDSTSQLWTVYPMRGARTSNLGECCTLATRRIAGLQETSTSDDLRNWWANVEKPFEPERFVQFGD